ncbi:MAG TPA: hypothetical protein VMI54_20120 [Polyangiaceae bacterium]|nr:hypothetical protein [Polyangiaceae bacterium]
MRTKTTVIVKNQSTVLTDGAVRAALPAFQRQVSEDFADAWGIDATIELAPLTSTAPPHAYLLYLFDDADQAGALGYHDLGQQGQPLGKVFAKSVETFGGLWTVAFSHELLEMLVDPAINLLAFDEEAGRAYAYDVCDAVEADQLGYAVGGVSVSNFVHPSWFDPTSVASRKHDHCGQTTQPFEMPPGGYIGFLELGGGGWRQIMARTRSDARLMSVLAAPSPFDARPRVGSRRERRRTPRSHWLRSTRP